MRWLKIVHNGGVDHLNLDHVYRVKKHTATEVIFYDANSVLPVGYVFASAADCDFFLAQLSKIVTPVDLSDLAPQ